ncbi:hypothetical protein [Pseudomonas oryziphila]|uniref:Uncharacterized protein n=1 Tax=Pseudomonas oryziphila TaxID=2894079 RepID=A0ABM7CSR4_9PSED|nr:hypothetical protein [Pseudomonas oryziphila]AZL74512.1 hypothetical protein EI693_16120 [Pseudomonas oryziphila]
MVTSDLIAILRSQVESAKHKGLAEVSLESLSSLVDLIENEAKQSVEGVEHSQVLLEKFRSDLVNWQNANQRDHESALEMLRATISTSHLAIKSALLINGGAAVAFLAFLGTAWSRFPSAAVKALLAGSLEYFVFGVMLTGLGAGASYFCQAAFAGDFGVRGEKVAEVLRWLAALLVLASFVTFYLGCDSAIRAFVMAG